MTSFPRGPLVLRKKGNLHTQLSSALAYPWDVSSACVADTVLQKLSPRKTVLRIWLSCLPHKHKNLSYFSHLHKEARQGGTHL